MIPALFQVGGFAVETHGLFVLLGVTAAVVVLAMEARRRRIRDPRLVWIAVGALFCGAVGAKLSTVWRYALDADDPSLHGALLYGGKSVLGGLAGAYVGVLLTKRIVGWTTSTGDLFAPAVALGMAIGRWGCFLTEQVGTPTSLPWGLAVSPEAAARIPHCPGCVAGVAMHPSFLYEIAFHAAMFGVLLWLRPRVSRAGDLFKIYLGCYAVFRFVVEFVRANPVMWAGLSGSQLFLLPSLVLMAVYAGRRWAASRTGPDISWEEAALCGRTS
ncbi:MAG: prolipoprotein diacylglyceryl transferase [Actinomycetota bacterium]|nr:prolipoprotein diacylglyceryl transferase [Actinomycetota bacterium]